MVAPAALRSAWGICFSLASQANRRTTFGTAASGPRANGLTGTTSDRPVLERFVKLRNSSSSQVRGASGSTAAMKLPGTSACRNENTYANAQATSVNVAPRPSPALSARTLPPCSSAT